MNNLSVQLLIKPVCRLIAVDNSCISNLIDITKYISLEFLVPHDSKYPDFKTMVLKEYRHNREEYNFNVTEIPITNDGTYVYYKFFIPTIEYLVELSNTYNASIKDQIFYHKNNIYFIDQNIEGEVSISDILKSSKKIDDYLLI